jgi:hypothetical protein
MDLDEYLRYLMFKFKLFVRYIYLKHVIIIIIIDLFYLKKMSYYIVEVLT